MNILKIPLVLITLLSSIILLSCSKEVYFSGISKNNFNEIKENYQKIEYSKEDVITIKNNNVISEVVPKQELANAYKQNTGAGIIEPTVKEKQFITENKLPELDK